MRTMPSYQLCALDPDSFTAPAKVQLDRFLDDHRAGLLAALDDLTEQQVRRSLVPSATTLLGVVKHGTFIEKVWFDEAITGRSRSEIGIPESPDESFVLRDEDTVESIRAGILREQVLAERVVG